MELFIAIVTTAILQTSPAPREPQGPAAVAGGQASPRSWAIVHGSSIWVCWSAAADCWQRVDLEVSPTPGAGTADILTDGEGPDALAFETRAADVLELSQLRMAFAGPRRLWIEIGDRRWQLERGHRRAVLAPAEPTVPLRRPSVPRCGHGGVVPTIRAGSPGWHPAPPCEAAASSTAAPLACLAPLPPRPRKATGLHLRAAVELSAQGGWQSDPELTRLRRRSGLAVLFVVEVGFDPTARTSAARSRQQLLARSRRRALPPIAPGPLAEEERRALVQVTCTEPRR
ncbi:MAG: hypothetical protein KC457_03420 [Myxococcales bacterium]|nr:hypothetical protein [Myxococcales bacterium]